jgi:hypothetical protein
MAVQILPDTVEWPFSLYKNIPCGCQPLSSICANLLCKGLSKLANILFARQLQRTFDAEGIDAISMALHPGLIKTGMGIVIRLSSTKAC